MNFEKRLVVSTSELDWTRDRETAVQTRALDELTWLVRLPPGGELPLGSVDEECLVLEGSVGYHGVELECGTYLRLPSSSDVAPLCSESGCTVFRKCQPFAPGDAERVVKRTHQAPWFPGQGRLEVMPLHEHEGRSTALVKWPAGERFVPHQHWGGEEILVLSGTFMDEHGRYPTGSWVRSPHLSKHHPFVEEETTILVKVGHLA